MKKYLAAITIVAALGTPAMAQKGGTAYNGPFGPDAKAKQVATFAVQGAALGCGAGAVVGSMHGAWGPGCGIGAAVLGGFGAILGHILPAR